MEPSNDRKFGGEALTRREFSLGAAGLLCLLPLDLPLLAASKAPAQAFVHPGMLHGAADFERMRRGIAARQQPLYAGFERLRDDTHSQLSYAMRGPFAEAGRGPSGTVHIQEFDSDAAAAYQTALMWAVTGDVRYAVLSRRIVDGWAQTQKAITGVDAILGCGLGGFLYLNAAEILRSTGQASADDVTAWKKFFREVYLPVIAEFAPFANGNWDTAALKTVMAIGIFCDDNALYDHAVSYYLYGCGDGQLAHYIYPDGQCQESGRDQAHTQLGEGHMGDCCEMAWQQGLDLYAALDNRLLKGFEYTARYQLGGEVPFTPDTDQTGKYAHTVISARHPKMQPIFEQIYNHYVQRMGLPAPNTERAAAFVRPEGPDSAAHPGFGTLTYTDPKRASADHPGFGTLAFTRERQAALATAPGGAAVFGVQARGQAGLIALQWLPLHGTERYAVQRATADGGPFRTVASHLQTASWVDTAVAPSSTYFYRVQRERTGVVSLVAGATAGLPLGWRSTALSAARTAIAAAAPSAFFDGSRFTLAAAGERHSFAGGVFVAHTLGGARSITVRLVPRIASQLLMVGLMARAADGAQSAALYLSPDAVGVDEHPQWFVRLAAMTPSFGAADDAQKRLLGTPAIHNGRVQGELWFRLTRDATRLQGEVSTDGLDWQPAGSLEAAWLTDRSEFGLALSSGLGVKPTEIVLDHVVLA